LSQVAALASLLLFALNLLLFLLPGLAVMLVIAARRQFSAAYAVMLTVVASATVGYVAFWAYFAGRVAGRIFSYGVIAASIVIVAVLLKRESALRVLIGKLCVPFGYVLATGICYTCLLFLFKHPFATGVEFANVRFFSDELPGDNQIPLIFAERIYAQQPVKPFCCGDWLSSDRPPLQAGIFLLPRPLKTFGNVRLNYELLAIALECLWICGVWVLVGALRAPPERIKQVLGFLVFSGFLFYNSVYVWPKLLAATFVLFVFSILLKIRIERRPITWLEALIAAVSFALALMAHPGAIFSAPALLVMLVWNWRFLNTAKLLAGVAVIAMFATPWLAYQRVYDPPGNRVLKMHLAGVGPIDSRSTWQAIKDAYGSMDAKTIAKYKWANLRMPIGPHPFLLGRSEESRRAQRDYIANALGILNAGWIGLALAVLKKRSSAMLPCSGLLIGISLLNLLVWCFVLIGPGYTQTAELSYADFLLLSIGLIGFLLVLPQALVVSLFGVQILSLFTVWVFVKPPLISASNFEIGLLIAGVLSAAALAWHFGKNYFANNSNFSKCLARISTSRFTREPGE
jgi:hypothetical protein